MLKTRNKTYILCGKFDAILIMVSKLSARKAVQWMIAIDESAKLYIKNCMVNHERYIKLRKYCLRIKNNIN